MKNVKKKESKINWLAGLIILMGFSALREGGTAIYISPILFGLGYVLLIGKNWKESFSIILAEYGAFFLILSAVSIYNYFNSIYSTSLTLIGGLGSLYLGILFGLLGWSLWKYWEQRRIGIIFLTFSSITTLFLIVDVFIIGDVSFYLIRLFMAILFFGMGYCFMKGLIKKEKYNMVGLITLVLLLAFLSFSSSQSKEVEKTYLGNLLLDESGVLTPDEYKAYKVELAANEDVFIRLSISSGRANTLLMNDTEYKKLINETNAFVYYY